MKSRALVVFDVDGTLSHSQQSPVSFSDETLLALKPWSNVVSLAAQYMERDHVELLFCTGRPKSAFSVTWRWLNKQLGLGSSGKRVSLACRPDDIDIEQIPSFKLQEITRTIRRTQAVEVSIYDDDARNLALLSTLSPMVRRLRLFRCVDGVTTPWEL